MKIIKAGKQDKTEVLKLLDEFRTECLRIISPPDRTVFSTASESGESVFEQVINSTTSAIYLAISDNEYIGILTIHKIPRIRRADFCAEIEEMYVKPAFQGKNVANDLMTAAIDWALENNIKTIRLESNNALERAHSFYEKTGFINYGKAYELAL